MGQGQSEKVIGVADEATVPEIDLSVHSLITRIKKMYQMFPSVLILNKL